MVVADDHAKTLIVLHFLHPDDAIGVGGVHNGEIGIEDGIDEDHHHRAADVRQREIHSAGRAILHCLFDEHTRNRKACARVFLDLFLQMPRDVDHLFDVAELHHIVHHVAHYRPAGDFQHRLRYEMRVRAQARPFAGQRDYDLHGVRRT